MGRHPRDLRWVMWGLASHRKEEALLTKGVYLLYQAWGCLVAAVFDLSSRISRQLVISLTSMPILPLSVCLVGVSLW